MAKHLGPRKRGGRPITLNVLYPMYYSMEDYEPLCLWECWTCDKQFLYASLITPVVCPFCYEVGTVQFGDNIEEPHWRPPTIERDDENEQ